jgi:YidC/Oxa1 family membrane protein insertase
MDRKTALALALALLVFALFTALQARYAPRRPITADSTHVSAPGAASPSAASGNASAPGLAAITPAAAAAPAAPISVVPEQRPVIETPLYRAEFSSRGARLVSFSLKRFSAAWGASQFASNPGKRPHAGRDVPEGDRVQLSGEPTFGVDLGSGGGLHSLASETYAVAESTDAAGAVRALTFTLLTPSGPTIRQTWRVRPDTYLLDLELETRDVPAAWKLSDYSLTIRSWPLTSETNLLTDLRGLEAVSLVGKDMHHDGAAGLVGRAPRLHDGVAHWAGVRSHYFLGLVGGATSDGRAALAGGFPRQLTAEDLKRRPEGTKPVEPGAEGTLVMPLSSEGVHRFTAYFGPADYFVLSKQAGPLDFERAVNMGYNWMLPLSKLLLWLLRSLNGVVRNYGITILLLATIVRLALHPLNMSSMKSMRAMQRLQPELERIKEKYKNDTQAMNTATMALYKDNGVNPAGGCLPMLLQMPLFFAMYAVISNAIDLRQAPFFGWIHDLSAPDQLATVAGFPIRVLPLLMAATGFLSQRFTPTTPQQAPTMYMMNAVMLVIFYNLPSGLVFYWTVMNLLTAAQQWLAIRGDGASTVVVVPAEAAGKGRQRK